MTRLRHISFYCYLIALLAMGCSEETTLSPDAQAEEDQVQVTFTLALGGQADVQTRAAGDPWEPGYKPGDIGNSLDNRIDPKQLHVVLYKGDDPLKKNEYIGEVKNLVYFATNQPNVYQFIGSLPIDSQHLNGQELSAKLVVYANWGTDFKPTNTRLDLITNPTFAQTTPYIPMWGIKTLNITLTPGVRTDIGSIYLLRAMAKVVVRLSEKARANGFTQIASILTRYNEKGYCLPADFAQVNHTTEIKENLHTDSSFISQSSLNLNSEGDSCAIYIPEYQNEPTADANTTNKAAQIQVTLTNQSGETVNGTIDFKQYKDGVAQKGTDYNILRNHLYRFTVNVLDRELSVQAEDWKLGEVPTDLLGNYFLKIDKTRSPIKSGEQILVHYDTNVPQLQFESEQIQIAETAKDLFVMRDDPSTKTFTIEINPEIPIDQIINKKNGFIYVVAGNLKKRIELLVEAEYYLTVTPPSYTVYIKDIPNHLTAYEVKYLYRTNLPYVTIEASRVIDDLLTADSNLEKGEGTYTCTLNSPHTAATFKKNIQVTYTFQGYLTNPETTKATPKLTATVLLRVVPNAQKYTLHFRPITDNWTAPHIYVYEPLYTPKGTEIQIPSNPEGENAVLYGFTGKRTFKGWTSQGGTIENPVKGNDQEGAIYKVGADYDPNRTVVYNENVDYCPDYRTDCCNTHVNPKWPGVLMKKDPENPGWYIFDIPVLAQPGKALIMFADGHESTDKDAAHRYPAHMVPGIPLYNFVDKEGWFLYDYDHSSGRSDVNEFMDDKPNILDLEAMKGTFRIWNKNSFSNCNQIYAWYKINNVTTEPFGKWDNHTPLTAGTEGKYIEFTADWSTYPSKFGVIFKLNGTNQSGDIIVTQSQWKKVKGKTYQYEVDL